MKHNEQRHKDAPPSPKTATVDPGFTLAVLCTAPTPVVMPLRARRSKTKASNNGMKASSPKSAKDAWKSESEQTRASLRLGTPAVAIRGAHAQSNAK